HLGAGQRVGIGWLAGSCMACEFCLSGRENLCRQNQPTCVGRHGGFASHVRVDARFAAALPASLSSEFAAPLLCAGITVFAPLRRQKLGRGARVGIVGLGGLGHLAVQFAAALDYRVTVFSTAANKETDVRRFGADRFVDVSKPGALAAAADSCDFILSTVPVDLPWPEYLNLLKPDGQLCIVGAAPGDVRVPAFVLIDGQKSIGGSAVGSNAEITAMLRFAAEFKISPQIERFTLAQVNLALDRARKNRLRYRAVLEIGR
ncbi:MAG TPA: zinc-binding dehydrogenase, partial [Candidatus Binatus sp.]|nr:zinc-binding dehydrogenase [Candidatus Binatus sp.]